MVQIAFFKIDLERLQQMPDLGLFLQLLATYNDINSLGYLGKMLMDQWKAQRDANEWTNDKGLPNNELSYGALAHGLISTNHFPRLGNR